MPQSQIQATVDCDVEPAGEQPVRDAAVCAAVRAWHLRVGGHPLIFQVGYYTSVAGLGLSPNDVVINGAIDVVQPVLRRPVHRAEELLAVAVEPDHQHVLPSRTRLTPAPPEDPGCANSNDLYAISQAAPMRRVHVNGLLFLMDYCTRAFTSGGFIADSQFDSSTVDQRLAAAVGDPQQPARRLDQRRVEPGVLGRHRARRRSASRAATSTRPWRPAR